MILSHGSKACLPTRLHLFKIYYGSQHSKEDNEGIFSSAHAHARDPTNRYKSRALIGFDRQLATLTAPKSMDVGKLDGPQFPKVIRPLGRERSHPLTLPRLYGILSPFPLSSSIHFTYTMCSHELVISMDNTTCISNHQDSYYLLYIVNMDITW